MDSEWLTCFDESSQSSYYYNTVTGLSQWEAPLTDTDPSSSPLPHTHSFGPGGIRPQISHPFLEQHSNEISESSSPPVLMKTKSKPQIKISFKSKNKIIPIVTDPQLLEGYTPENTTSNDEFTPQKSRPTVKLKGELLLSLKRSQSGQHLSLGGKEEEKYAPSESYNALPTEIDPNPLHEFPSQHDHSAHSNYSIASAQPQHNQPQHTYPPVSKDYLGMATLYRHHLPYSRHGFNQRTKCVKCHLGTPTDILFPCAHRSLCHSCLSQAPYDEINASKQKKVTCPLCKVTIKQVIPINGQNTEEKIYWDGVSQSHGSSDLPEDFLNEFPERSQENIENHRLELSAQRFKQTEQDEDEDKGVGEEDEEAAEEMNKENSESEKEHSDSKYFPQFVVKDDKMSQCVCVIQ